MKTFAIPSTLLSLTAALLACPLNVWSATQTYDDANGANVWDTTTSNWDGSTVPWTNGNDAVFGGTGEAVAISPVTVQNLTINSTGYSFTGGLLTFAGTTPTVTAAQDVTLAATVTGTAGLIKTGAGVLTVSETGSITGGITVNQGTLRMNQSGHAFNTANGWNGGAVTVNAGGTVVLANSFNAGYSRAFTINGGTLNATAGAAADSNNYLNNLTLQNGASVTGNALRMGYHSNATVTVGGTSASTISGRLLLVNGGGYSATFNVADVTTSSATDLTVSGIISDYSGLAGTPVIKSGAGTLLLSGVNTYSGGTTINAGRITMGDNSALGTGAVTLNGGALERNAAGVTVANSIAVAAGGGTLLGRQVLDDYTTFSGQLTGSGALSVQGLVALGNTGNTYSGAITVSNATTSYLRLSASEVLGNTATVSLAGSGSYLRLDGGVTETIGGLSSSGGEIFVASAGNGTLKFGGNDGSTSFSGALSNGGGQLFLVKQGTGTFTFAPTTTTYAGLTVSKGTVLSTNANGGAGPAVTLGDTDTGASAVAFLTTSSGASRNITVSANGTGTATIGSTTGAGSGNVVFSGTTTLNRATTLTGASTDRTTWTGQITGNVGTLTIAGETASSLKARAKPSRATSSSPGPTRFCRPAWRRAPNTSPMAVAWMWDPGPSSSWRGRPDRPRPSTP